MRPSRFRAAHPRVSPIPTPALRFARSQTRLLALFRTLARVVSRTLGLLLLATGLGACGRNAEALNEQGYRAMRFGAHIDAGYFFLYAGDLIGEEGVPEGAEVHPEAQRLVVGKLALDLFTAPVDLPSLPDRAPDEQRVLTPDQTVLAQSRYRVPRGMNAIRAAIADRTEAFTPEDFAFLTAQLFDEAHRPAEARELLAFARERFPEFKPLAELDERLPEPTAEVPPPAGFLERRSPDPPIEDLIAMSDQLAPG